MKSKQTKLLICEFAGVIFVLICSFFMSKLYGLCSGQLVGVMFGSVNGSVWESCKTLLLPYLLFGLLELLSVSPSMRRFTAAKTISLYFLGAVYIGLRMIAADSVLIKIICVALSFLLSAVLYFSKLKLEQFFPPSVFLLFLFWAFYFSFTPFPPKNAVFSDPETGMYGIIPNGIVGW